MSREESIRTVPQSTAGKPLSVIYSFIGDSREVEWTVDSDRKAGKHICLWEEYDLVHHVRCKVCGKCRMREEQVDACS